MLEPAALAPREAHSTRALSDGHPTSHYPRHPRSGASIWSTRSVRRSATRRIRVRSAIVASERQRQQAAASRRPLWMQLARVDERRMPRPSGAACSVRRRFRWASGRGRCNDCVRMRQLCKACRACALPECAAGALVACSLSLWARLLACNMCTGRTCGMRQALVGHLDRRGRERTSALSRDHSNFVNNNYNGCEILKVNSRRRSSRKNPSGVIRGPPLN